MTNAETISKLNEALSTLIKAYEELQEENTGLKARINELEDEVLELESAKEDLENILKNSITIAFMIPIFCAICKFLNPIIYSFPQSSGVN